MRGGKVGVDFLCLFSSFSSVGNHLPEYSIDSGSM